MKRYTGPIKWHQVVQWAIQTAIGQSVQTGETTMPIERYVQRSKFIRRVAWRDCAKSRAAWRQKD